MFKSSVIQLILDTRTHKLLIKSSSWHKIVQSSIAHRESRYRTWHRQKTIDICLEINQASSVISGLVIRSLHYLDFPGLKMYFPESIVVILKSVVSEQVVVIHYD